MFSNYFKNDTRPTPLNLLVARILLGLFGIILVLQIDPSIYTLLDFDHIGSQIWYGGLFPHENILNYIWLIQLVTVLLLFGFILGIRTKVTAILSAIFISYLGTLLWTFMMSPNAVQYAIVVNFLLLFAVFGLDDVLRYDELSRSKEHIFERLDNTDPYYMGPLKWGLFLLGIMYFQEIAKILPDGSWLINYDESIQRAVIANILWRAEITPMADFILFYDSIAILAAVGTIVLQVGFIFAIVFGYPVKWFFVGLLGLHWGIALTMNITYVYYYMVLFTLFLSYDSLLSNFSWQKEMYIYYRPKTTNYLRLLLLFKCLDVQKVLYFRRISDGRDKSRINLSGDEVVVLSYDGSEYPDREAVKRILNEHLLLKPIAYIIP